MTFKHRKLHNTQLLPSIWLLVLILSIPQLSDTFTSHLDVTNEFQASDVIVEYATTAYLCGFALGALFWGKLCDRFRHKPCVLAGFILFAIGCTGCYFSNTIETLMISRVAQAFGSSAGYVVGHAICRGAFHGQELGKVYASMESVLAIVPIIGSLVSIVIDNEHWRALFLLLNIFAGSLILLITLRLPETRRVDGRRVSIIEIGLKLLKNKKVVGYCLIISACLSISFRYYDEGTFYLVDILGLSSNKYEFSAIFVAISYMAGGIFSRHLHHYHRSKIIMKYGLIIIAVSSVAFCFFAALHIFITNMPLHLVIVTAIFSQICIMFGMGMTVSNAFALALVGYRWCIGTASSLFGFFYYTLMSLFTFGINAVHNGTLLPMPLYLFGASIFMLIVQKTMIDSRKNLR